MSCRVLTRSSATARPRTFNALYTLTLPRIIFIFVFHSTHVRMSYVLNSYSYLLTYSPHAETRILGLDVTLFSQ